MNRAGLIGFGLVLIAHAWGCGGRSNGASSEDGGGAGSPWGADASSGDGSSSGSSGAAVPESGSTSGMGIECSAALMCGGVCSDMRDDPNNCGGCGKACSGATSFCEGGACTAGPPSCQPGGGGLTQCGAGSESCCTSLAVPGGTFYRTYTNSGSGPTGEADPATVSGFRLDKYLVTVGRFRQFVNAWSGSGYTPPVGSGKHTYLNGGLGLSLVVGSGIVYEPGWVASDDSNIAPTATNLACMTGDSTWTPAVGSNEQFPINCVTWAEAYAFCIWDGGFLPSLAEWEDAAAGGNEQREYPWGATDPSKNTAYAIYTCDYTGVYGCGLAPVGTALRGAGRWGHLDLAGEVDEWLLDYVGNYVTPCVDCAFLTAPYPIGREVRGGEFPFGTADLLPTYRDASPPNQRLMYYGFRCARTP